MPFFNPSLSQSQYGYSFTVLTDIGKLSLVAIKLLFLWPCSHSFYGHSDIVLMATGTLPLVAIQSLFLWWPFSLCFYDYRYTAIGGKSVPVLLTIKPLLLWLSSFFLNAKEALPLVVILHLCFTITEKGIMMVPDWDFKIHQNIR